MKTRIMAGVAATALALSIGAASAAEVGGAGIMDGGTPGYLEQQQQLRNEPGYSVGTGAAHIGDGSDPDYTSTNRALRSTPGYQYGAAVARVPYAQ